MRVLVAMSGGVDSSVAAALLLRDGHDVAGATLKLWGGPSDAGCCSVADVEDARRVARALGIEHHVFNYAEIFDRHVVQPYVDAHAQGLTPNPCIECNRHVKFGALLDRVSRLGYDVLATGHHARVVAGAGGARLRRGADRAKDQSYVLAMLRAPQLERLLLPVGEMTKGEVRAAAARLGLATAAKKDSQDVCFIHSASGRGRFLADRIPLHTGTLLDAATGAEVGSVPAVELVTPGQRRGLGVAVDGRRRFALSVDVSRREVVVGDEAAAATTRLRLRDWTWVADALDPGTAAVAQTSAHGRPAPCRVEGDGLCFDEPQRIVAPGQTVALYDAAEPDLVVGAAVVAA
ncbi:MAG: tRNA 2-thiouridine(34) synthase MnmA [Acidimicrobiales bacterium]